MIEVLSCILITALFVNGLNISTQDGMLLQPLKRYLYKNIGEYKLYKPLIGCVRCMPSIYGTTICILFLPISWHLIYLIPVVIACSSTVATIIHSLYI